jgi:hypothetical protein
LIAETSSPGNGFSVIETEYFNRLPFIEVIITYLA